MTAEIQEKSVTQRYALGRFHENYPNDFLTYHRQITFFHYNLYIRSHDRKFVEHFLLLSVIYLFRSMPYIILVNLIPPL